jgi:hypothetical protein
MGRIIWAASQRQALHDFFPDPTFNRLSQFAQPSLEEMVSAFNQNKSLRFRNRRKQGFQLRPRTKLVACSADEQLWLGTILQEIQLISARCFRILGDRNRRNSHADYGRHSSVGTCGAQPDRRAEGESRKQQRQVELRIQPVESGAHIIDFAVSVIVLAVAESGATEVEAQHRKTKAVQRLHGMKHDLIMQRPAKQRMRMANDCGVSRALGTRIEQRLESSCWAFEEERSDGGSWCDHTIQIT